ncbi:hypothetical protein MKX01_001663 [Papaver californicum]|nr:hypothetical protein MKX01_001663 [Papaver californicum]
MFSILSRFTRVYLTNLSTQRQRSSHPLYLVQHVKWCHNESHYNHGIPGIPNDGKVVLLGNSITGSQVYLIGVLHGTKESAETVKKVINAVRPDAVALELCKQRALLYGMWKVPEKVGLVRMFLMCMRRSGGLKQKIDKFLYLRRLQASLMGGMEFTVAMEEPKKVKAKLVICKQVRSLSIPGSIFYRKLSNYIERVKEWLMPVFSPEKVPRSYIAEKQRLGHHYISPEHDKLIVQERDILMCTRLRRLEEKIIVVVVGMAHMDGIELLWKHAEDHYNHGIPGIPNDGKVVLLGNSITGSQVYLIGVLHGTKESAETVKKVINAVRPDTVALELCKQRALLLGGWKKPEKLGLVRMFLGCMRSSGGLKRKIDTFFGVRRLQASLMRVLELKVGMEEAQKVKARLVLIDQDAYYQRLDDLDPVDILKKGFMLLFFPERTPRSNMEGLRRWFQLIFPYKVIFKDKDILMCTKLRRLEEKLIVAVVGLGHMDGIELLWKYAEVVGDDKLPSATWENGRPQAPFRDFIIFQLQFMLVTTGKFEMFVFLHISLVPNGILKWRQQIRIAEGFLTSAHRENLDSLFNYQFMVCQILIQCFLT